MKVMTMQYRMFNLGAAALALCVVSTPVFATEEAGQAQRAYQSQRAEQVQPGSEAQRADQEKEAIRDGKVVSINDNKLAMTDKDDKQHSFVLPADAKVTLDEKACKAQDLKAGTKIRVTTKSRNPLVATHVEAIDKNELFANTHAGKVVSISGNRLTMADEKGKEHSHTLSEDAQVTLDGKACKPQDLKADMQIRVTTKRTDEAVAIMIEAIDEDGQFAQVR